MTSPPSNDDDDLDDLDALISSMSAPPAIPESMRDREPRERKIVRSRSHFDKPVKKIRDGGDAFELLAYLVKTYSPHGQSEVAASDAASEIYDRDKPLAEFVQANTGQLEDALLKSTNMRRMAFTRTEGEHDGSPTSLLSRFMSASNPMQGELLWRTMREIDTVRLAEIALTAASRYKEFLVTEVADKLLEDLVGSFTEAQYKRLRKALKKTRSIASERLDVLELLFRRGKEDKAYRLPDILPEDKKIAAMKADKILGNIAAYYGASPEIYSAHLAEEKLIPPDGHPGELIRADAARLVELGVSRLDLAARMAAALDAVRAHALKRRDELREIETGAQENGRRLEPDLYNEIHGVELEEDFSMGIWADASDIVKGKMLTAREHRRDPFHAADTFALSPEVGGMSDFLLVNTKRNISFVTGDMQPYLIRRGCLFYGKYRVEPEQACRVLGLI